MKKSKLLAILLCMALLFTVAAACNKDNGTQNTEGTSSSPSSSGDTSPSSGGDTSPSSGGNTSPTGGGDASPTGGGDASPAGDGSSSGRDTLSIAIDNDSGVLVPGLITGGQYIAIQSIYEPLWDVDEDGNMIPILMESYEEVAPDNWIVHLRQGVYFSNGVEMTADDVVFSLKYWKTFPVNSVRVQSLDEERTKAIDKYTLDMYMMNGYYYFHDTASSMFMIHCEQGFDEDDLNLHPVGTGPYVLTEYVVNSHIFLERRDDYWGKMPEIKYLEFRVLAEPSQVVNAITTGMIDIARIGLDDVEYVDSLPGFATRSRYIGGGVGLSFNSGVNSQLSRFEDPDKSLDMRYAIYHAINPQVIIDLVYEGKGEIMHNVVPDYMFDYLPEYDNMNPAYEIGYNLDRARELAISSGLAGRTIVMVTNGLATAVQIAEIVQNMLAQIDVNVEIQNYDPATIWSMIYDPDAEYEISVGEGIAPNWRVCDLLLNGVRYSTTLTLPDAFPGNDWYLANCEKMAHEPDPVLRREVTEQCLQMFMDQAIGFGLCKIQVCNAFSIDIDLNSIIYSVCTGTVRINDLKWA